MARLHNLYGKNEDERVQCDIAEEAIVEAKDQLWRFFWDNDQEKKAALFAVEELNQTLDNLQKWFGRRGDEPQFWVGESLTFVDFFAFTYLDEVRAFFPEALGEFPRLRSFHGSITSRPRITRYLGSARRPISLGVGAFGTKLDPAVSNI